MSTSVASKESGLGCVGAMFQGAAKLSSGILPCSASRASGEPLGLGEKVDAILMQTSSLCVFLEILGSRLPIPLPACIFWELDTPESQLLLCIWGPELN